MTSEDCAYVAGMMDADGCITMTCGEWPTKQGGLNYTYAPNISIVNKDLQMLVWIQSLFGGTVKPRSRKEISKHAKHWSQCYDWMPSVPEVEFLLVSILPYLKVKRRQAELILEYLDSRQNRRVQYRLNESVKQRRKEIFSEIKSLNRVGIPMERIQ